MSICKLRDSTIIGDYEKPYIVAEVNTSHNGSVDTAKKMIDKASEIRCSCVKFQSWSAESLYSKSYYDKNPIAKRIVKNFSLDESELLELSKYCKNKNIAFASTPYSNREVNFLLEECDVPYIKIASMDINNIPFLKYIAATDAPIVLSTGMSTMDEIKKAVTTIEDAGNRNLCLLHCISLYPTELHLIRLHNILGLRDEFHSYPIGFSDHSIGIEMDIAATALGSSMIEKHFTLDHTKIGMDNQMATEPNEMKNLVESCNNVYLALGGKERIVPNAELEQRKKMRRSVIANTCLKKGTVISENDLSLKRPGTGIQPDELPEVVGKILINDVECDTIIRKSDYM